jgi:hypothetical protein
MQYVGLRPICGALSLLPQKIFLLGVNVVFFSLWIKGCYYVLHLKGFVIKYLEKNQQINHLKLLYTTVYTIYIPLYLYSYWLLY